MLEIELWKINNSVPAPKFNLVERPNDWTKTLKLKDSLSTTQKTQLEFWQNFNLYAFSRNDFNKEFSQRKAHPQHWYSLSIGSSEYHLELTANTQKQRLGVGIYITDNKDLFEKFKLSKALIENELGVTLEWRVANKACRILAFTKGDIKESIDKCNDYFDWYCDMALKLKKIIKKYDI